MKDYVLENKEKDKRTEQQKKSKLANEGSVNNKRKKERKKRERSCSSVHKIKIKYQKIKYNTLLIHVSVKII